MRRLILTVLPLVLLLATVAPAAADPGSAIDGLRVTPPSGNFGRVEIGSCVVDYETGATTGCKFKTFRLTNVGSEPILISYFIYSSEPEPFDDVEFAVDYLTDDCIGLPLVAVGDQNYWSLAPGDSCTITIAPIPLVEGVVEGSIVVSGLNQFDVIAVIPLRARGYVES